MEGSGPATPVSGKLNLRVLRVEDQADARALLEGLGSDLAGVNIMSRKMVHLAVSVENVQARAAHIIKEAMLSRGGECATPRELLTLDGAQRVRVIMIGTVTQFRGAIKNLALQPFGMKELAAELKALLDSVAPASREPRVIDARGRKLEVGGRTLVMGVVNATPDSFSDGGTFERLEDARNRALQIDRAGVDVIDIGGESTRPGSEPVTLEEELRRTIPLIRSLAGDVSAVISIDTCKAAVAEKALEAGAGMVNDISGLRFDPDMIPVVAERRAPVVIMHMLGVPRSMQENPVYDDVVGDICRFFREQVALAMEGGVEPGMIMVDPGIGFGKTVEHNLEILRRLGEFGSLGFPVVLGTSRKRFIGAVLGRGVEERTMGTVSTVAFAIARGVDMVRVHDVEQVMDVARMADAAAGKRRDMGGEPTGP